MELSKKGVFIAYTKIIQNLVTLSLGTRKADKTTEQHGIGVNSLGSNTSEPGYQFNMGTLSSDYPSLGNFYYLLGADNTKKIMGEYIRLEQVPFTSGSNKIIFVSLSRL